MSKLSNDPKTGEPTIDGKPASKKEVRRILHQEGEWFGGCYDTTKPPVKGAGDGKKNQGR